jgi:hypothetical protein
MKGQLVYHAKKGKSRKTSLFQCGCAISWRALNKFLSQGGHIENVASTKMLD